jgi:hypothetical protein
MAGDALMAGDGELARQLLARADDDVAAAKIFGRVRVHQRDHDRYIDEHAIGPAPTVRDLIDVGPRMPAPRRGSLRAHA